jgi:hypothetical protein
MNFTLGSLCTFRLREVISCVMFQECITILWSWYFWCCARNQAKAYNAPDSGRAPTQTTQCDDIYDDDWAMV